MCPARHRCSPRSRGVRGAAVTLVLSSQGDTFPKGAGVAGTGGCSRPRGQSVAQLGTAAFRHTHRQREGFGERLLVPTAATRGGGVGGGKGPLRRGAGDGGRGCSRPLTPAPAAPRFPNPCRKKTHSGKERGGIWGWGGAPRRRKTRALHSPGWHRLRGVPGEARCVPPPSCHLVPRRPRAGGGLWHGHRRHQGGGV